MENTIICVPASAYIVHEDVCKKSESGGSVIASIKSSLTLLVTESGSCRFLCAYKMEDRLSAIYLHSYIIYILYYVHDVFFNSKLLGKDLRYPKKYSDHVPSQVCIIIRHIK